jgi:IPT/TIG domain/Laminin G domain
MSAGLSSRGDRDLLKAISRYAVATITISAVFAFAPAAGATTTVTHLWSMNEAAGTGTMYDSGSPTLTNGTWLHIQAGVPGYAGTAYRFDGTSRVTVPDDDSLDPGSNPFTATVHVKFTRIPDSSVGGDYDLIRKGLGSTKGGYWKLEIYPTNHGTQAQGLCQMKGSSANTKIVGAPASLNDGTWHTITCTKTDSNVTLTVDGSNYRKTVTIGRIANDDPLALGAKNIGGDWYIGDMDEVGLEITTSSTAGPSVTGFTPTAGPVGSSVTITGSGFTGATDVKFNDTSVGAGNYTVNSDAQITATVPSGASTGPISVTASGLTGTSSSIFTVTTTPTVSGFSPGSGWPGVSVTITGSSFTGASAISFGGTNAGVFTVNSDTQITATVPSGANTGPISVTASGLTGTSSNDFTVVPEPAPTITGFSPTSGPVGSSVTITGSAFTGASAVSFNGTTASFTVNSDGQISATVPLGATDGPISVTNPTDTGTSSTEFTVTTTPPNPIAEVQRKHASANDVTISATLTAPPEPGDVLVAVVAVSQAASPTFDIPAGWTSAFTPARGAVFWKVSDGSEQTVTVNLSAGQTARAMRMWVVELSGANTTTPFDQGGSGIYTTLTTSVTPTTAGPTAQANEWAIAVVSHNGDNGGSPAATSGFTVLTPNDSRDIGATKILGLQDTISTTISWTTARTGSWIIATFRGA